MLILRQITAVNTEGAIRNYETFLYDLLKFITIFSFSTGILQNART